MKHPVASLFFVVVVNAHLTAAIAGASLSVTSKTDLIASNWLRKHQQPDADELAELKSENPQAYAIVKALLTKRALGLLNPRHPSASFAAHPDVEDVPTGAAAFAPFQDPGASPAVASTASSAPTQHDWLNWKP